MLTVSKQLPEYTLWMRNATNMIVTGAISHVVAQQRGDVVNIVGVFPDNRCSPPLAKYQSLERAEDVITLIEQRARYARRQTPEHNLF